VELNRNILSPHFTRRGFIATAGVAGVATLTGCGSSTPNTPVTPPVVPPVTPTITDSDILNFALNLEYLEAEFYLRAATGTGLGTADGAGTVTGGSKVNFTSMYLQQLCNELAAAELAHVRAIRSTIGTLAGTAVGAPAIDFTNAFNALASLAGIGSSFNPFADQNSFLIGAGIFEDVGVTAYSGAAGLLTSKTVLSAAAGIQATEAYHAGAIRNLIAYTGNSTNMLVTNFNKVVTLRGTVGGSGTSTFETQLSAGSATAATTTNGPVSNVTPSTIVACDTTNALGFARTTSQVLHIVYATQPGTLTASGGFFPAGMNGTIKTPTA
jgi:hypothetical protein